MVKPLSASLKKIARGAIIVMAGLIGCNLLQFVARLIIARYGLEANYGVFSIALVMLNLAMVLSSLGLQWGATRFIAHCAARGDSSGVKSTVMSSIQLASISSVIVALILFLSADLLANNVFRMPDAAVALKIFAAGVPFITLVNILAAIFLGFNRVEPQVFFQYLMLNGVFCTLLGLSVLSGLSFTSIFYSYLVSIVIAFIGLVIYSRKKLREIPEMAMAIASRSIKKEILAFSFPLLGNALFSLIISWSDTLMMGFFRTAGEVGLYNSAYPLAQFIVMPIAALTFIYTPVASGLYSTDSLVELRRTFKVITKWLVSLTLPLFMILCFYPEIVITLFFGEEYIGAAPALRILAAGFMVNNFLGPNGPLLIAVGEAVFLFWCGLVSAIANIGLCIILIPKFGMMGAATASVSSMVLGNILPVIKLFRSHRAHPFSLNLIKPLLASVILTLVFQFVLSKFFMLDWWAIPIVFVIYYVIYAAATYLTRSFYDEDLSLVLLIAKRLGLPEGRWEDKLKAFFHSGRK